MMSPKYKNDFVNIIPVLLAGGSGTRLWPVSRKSYPKQFASIFENESLFQKSAKRLVSSDQLIFEKHLTITPCFYHILT